MGFYLSCIICRLNGEKKGKQMKKDAVLFEFAVVTNALRRKLVTSFNQSKRFITVNVSIRHSSEIAPKDIA